MLCTTVYLSSQSCLHPCALATVSLKREEFEVETTEKHTCPLAVSDSWRVHKFERFNEPSLKDIATPIVAVECDDKLLEYESQET